MKLFGLATTISAIFMITYSKLDITAIYTTDNGLLSNEVRSIWNDDGTIWIGSGSGAAYLKNSQWQYDDRNINPVVNGVSTLFKDSEGKFWFGGLNEGHVLNNDVYQTYSIADDMGINGRVIFSFHEDREQNIWAATTGGVSVYNGSDWKPMTTENGLKHNVVHDIDEDENGRLWFATRKGGLNIFDGENWTYHYPDLNCRKILRDKKNVMWIGTNDGIIKFDGHSWEVLEPGNVILPMFEGSKGLIWCVANGVDLIRIARDGQSIYYEDPTNGQAGEIYHLEHTENGSVWAGSDQGIFIFH